MIVVGIDPGLAGTVASLDAGDKPASGLDFDIGRCRDFECWI